MKNSKKSIANEFVFKLTNKVIQWQNQEGVRGTQQIPQLD